MSRRFPRNFEGNARCRLMFPVSVCLRIGSKRFVEEETQRKRRGSPAGHLCAELAIFWRTNQNGRASSNERTLPQMILTTEGARPRLEVLAGYNAELLVG